MTRRRDGGFCLQSPQGKVIAETFDTDQDECWSKSYNYLYATKKWMKPYYKKWHESITAAEAKGWVVVEALVVSDK